MIVNTIFFFNEIINITKNEDDNTPFTYERPIELIIARNGKDSKL